MFKEQKIPQSERGVVASEITNGEVDSAEKEMSRERMAGLIVSKGERLKGEQLFYGMADNGAIKKEHYFFEGAVYEVDVKVSVIARRLQGPFSSIKPLDYKKVEIKSE